MSSLWLLRRKGFASVKLGFARSGAGDRRMELVEQMPLTPHHSLHLVRVEDRLILIALSSKQRLLFVVHAEVERVAIRIISARKASPAQRKIYDEELG